MTTLGTAGGYSASKINIAFNPLYSPCPFPLFQSFTTLMPTKNFHLAPLLMPAVQP
jgi:hypothetical protein